MKKTIHSVILISFIIFSSGCAYFGLRPGDKPSDTPPQLVTPPGQKQFWNNSKLFGPVPKEYQAEGNKECVAQGNKTAIGYHPNPKKYDGTFFGKRGYLCDWT